MRTTRGATRARMLTTTVALSFLACAGCDATGGIIGGTIGATLLGAHSPAQEIEQVYYLGVFDPLEQVPAEVYRLTVRGQASAISGMKFGSGWVPAAIIDTLNTDEPFRAIGDAVETPDEKPNEKPNEKPAGDPNGGAGAGPRPAPDPADALCADDREGNGDAVSPFAGLDRRRLVLFGPEGFREAPRNHRLVVVMGASPEKFFSAIDEALAQISSSPSGKTAPDPEIQRSLIDALLLVQDERKDLVSLATWLDGAPARNAGGQEGD